MVVTFGQEQGEVGQEQGEVGQEMGEVGQDMGQVGQFFSTEYALMLSKNHNLSLYNSENSMKLTKSHTFLMKWKTPMNRHMRDHRHQHHSVHHPEVD